MPDLPTLRYEQRLLLQLATDLERTAPCLEVTKLALLTRLGGPVQSAANGLWLRSVFAWAVLAAWHAMWDESRRSVAIQLAEIAPSS